MNVCIQVCRPAFVGPSFLTQLCLGDLFIDLCSPCENWPVMICHVSEAIKEEEERRKGVEMSKEKRQTLGKA